MTSLANARPARRVPSRPQSSVLAEQLRTAIHTGELPPDTHLSEYALAAQFRTSRTPIRHALNLLSGEDLVIYREHRGYIVRSMTLAEVQGRLRVRATMEGLAARIVATRGLTAVERTLLRGALAQCHDLTAMSSWEEPMMTRYLAGVEQFHTVLRRGANNQLLTQTIERSLRFPYRSAHDARVQWVEHEELVTRLLPQGIVPAANLDRARILDAIEERNGTRAEALIRERMFSVSQAIDQIPGTMAGSGPVEAR